MRGRSYHWHCSDAVVASSQARCGTKRRLVEDTVAPCPLYPQKRTLELGRVMSALSLLVASLVGLRGRAAREKVGVGGEGRDGKLDVSRVRLGIRGRAIDCHPVSFGHCRLLCMISGCDETFFGVRG